jgi:hypothetical protein
MTRRADAFSNAQQNSDYQIELYLLLNGKDSGFYSETDS